MAAVITPEAELCAAAPMAVEVEAKTSEEAPGDSLASRLREEVGKVLQGLDLQSTTLGQMRSALETNLSLQAGALDEHKDSIRNLLQERIQQMQDKNAADEADAADEAASKDCQPEVEAETPPRKYKMDKKRRRLMEAAIRLARKCRRGDATGAGAPVVQQPELDGIEGPLAVQIGGMEVTVPLKTLYSGRRGFHTYQPVTVTMGGRKVELNCLITCAVAECKDLAMLQAELTKAESKDDAEAPQETVEATEPALDAAQAPKDAAVDASEAPKEAAEVQVDAAEVPVDVAVEATEVTQEAAVSEDVEMAQESQ